MPGKKRGRCKTAEVEADFVADALASFMDAFGSNDMKKIFKDLVEEQTARSRPRGWVFIKYHSLLHDLLSEAPNASIKHSVLYGGILKLASKRNIFRPNEELTEKANTYAVHIGWMLSKLRGVALQTYPIKPVKKGLKPAELQQLEQLIDMQDLDSPPANDAHQDPDVTNPDCQIVLHKELQKKFQQFSNTNDTLDTEQLEYVDMRKQRHPATYDLPDIKGPALYSKEKADDSWQWYPAGKAQDFPRAGGLAMKHGDAEVAVFNLSHRADDAEKWFATQNLCPFKQVRVISRGLVGEPASGAITIADPVYKTVYDLRTGQGITSPDLNLSTFQTRVTAEGVVEVKLPAPADYSAALTATVKKVVEESGVKAAKALGKSKPFDANGKHVALDW